MFVIVTLLLSSVVMADVLLSFGRVGIGHAVFALSLCCYNLFLIPRREGWGIHLHSAPRALLRYAQGAPVAGALSVTFCFVLRLLIFLLVC